MFVTYRDPNLSESYKVYDEAADYVADFDADDRDMKKYIIGTIGSMDMPMEAVDMGARSFHAYFLGKTEADLQKVRDQVLSCTQEDIRALAPIVKAVVEAGNRCCIGNEEKIDQNKEYFDEVKHVLQRKQGKDNLWQMNLIGFVTFIGRPNVGSNINEPSDRTEDRDHIKQTADNKKSYPDSVHR